MHASNLLLDYQDPTQKMVDTASTLIYRIGQAVGRYFLDLEGSQCMVYEWLRPITTLVAYDAQPEIFGAPLTLIFRMGQ
jgi:hypothetical protein